MMRLTLLLLSFVAVAATQLGEVDARILRWFITAELGAKPARPLLVSILADSSTTTDGPLLQQIRALGLPLVPLTARPGRDTLFLRVTRPVRDSLDYYRIGVERLTCRDGHLLGGRTLVSLRCSSDSCREYSETPLADDRLNLGSCGRP
jgi:hypothetical protein